MATIDGVLANILAVQVSQSMSARRLTALAFLAEWRYSRNHGSPLSATTWFMTASGPASFDIRDALMKESGGFVVYRAAHRGHRTTMCKLKPPTGNVLAKYPLAGSESTSINAILRATQNLPDAAVHQMVSRVDSVLSTSDYPGTPIEFAPPEQPSSDWPGRTR